MNIRGIRWPFVFAFLLVCGFTEICFGSCPLLVHDDTSAEREFENVCQNIISPQISTGTAQNLTIVNSTISFLTVTSTLTVNSAISFSPSVISYKIGTFAKPGSTGNQSVTGVGFQPRLVIFFGGFGAANSGRSGFGAMTSVNQASGGGIITEAGPDFGGDNTSSSKAYSEYDAASTATYVSMDTDGFTINWTAVNATITTIAYIAFR